MAVMRRASYEAKALCSVGAGPHAALLELSEPTFAAYAERHGYELVTSTEGDPSRPPAWTKISLLRDLIDSFDLVLWIDADAVVVDAGRDIVEDLPADRDFGLVQHRVGDQLIPNTGVMLLRAGAFARELLERIWSSTAYIDHPWWDNAALIAALGYDLPGSLDRGLRGRAHRLARRRLGRELRPCRPARDSAFLARTRFLSNEWNSIYHDPAEHPRIVHCPGTPVPERIRDLTITLERAGV